jgi:flagellar basal-body rod modification protein FlgD
VRVVARLYDARGRIVRTLQDATMPAGRYRLSWDGRDASGRSVAAGVYFLDVQAGGYTRTVRLLRIR